MHQLNQWYINVWLSMRFYYNAVTSETYRLISIMYDK